MASKNIILFVNAIRPATFAALDQYRQSTGRKFKPVVIVNSKIRDLIFERNGQLDHINKVEVISVDFDNPYQMRRALNPIANNIFAVTSQYENSILELQRLIPYLPYLSMPTEKSLDWATEKKYMRDILAAYDKKLVPLYINVSEVTKSAIRKIGQAIPYPLIVKPSALEGSLLVSLVKNKLELEKSLEFTVTEIQKGYDTWIKRQAPVVLVEEFMEGDMYSIDTYVSAEGRCYHTPPVRVVTGYKVGFEDFFGYMQHAPANLTDKQLADVREVAEKVCHALCLRSVTAHIELMKTKKGWKVVELGPRIGGFRHDIYSESYGINHIMNDILVRAGEAPVIPTKLRRHTAFFNIYSPIEGKLATVKGLDVILKLKSFRSVDQVVNVGELVQFARNNGDPVFKLTLSHKDSDQFKADVATAEKTLNFEVDENISNFEEPDFI